MRIRDVMSFEEFTYKFKEAVNEKGIEIDINRAIKVNREVTTICLANNETMRATIYMEDLYNDYMHGKAMIDIVDNAIGILNYADCNKFETPNFMDSEAKKCLCATVINKNMNKELLQKIPHQDMEDLALVARFRVNENYSCLVDNGICRSMQLTSEEVLDIAKTNSFAEGYRFKSLYEIIQDLGGPSDDELKEYATDNNGRLTDNMMYVLSTESLNYGACLLFNRNVLNEIHDKLGENYYIMPSSQHEILIVPQKHVDERNLERMRWLVQEVNRTEVELKDKLSDNVYYYDAKTCKLSIADGNERNRINTVKNTKTATRGR